MKKPQCAELRVSYRPAKITTQIKSSKDCYKVIKPLFTQSKLTYQEQFIALYLNRANNPIAYKRISEGGIAGTYVDAKLIFGFAVSCLASQIILAHSHPSGQLKPSTNNISLTGKLAAGAKLLDMEVLDHLIIAGEGYFSFADEGLI